MVDRADDYRRLAEECRARAAISRDPDHQRQYDEMAQGWLAMARNAERQQRSNKEDEHGHAVCAGKGEA